MKRVPFNVPPFAGREMQYIQQVFERKAFSGNGRFTEQCQAWITDHTGSAASFLTHSCTAALEMAAILSELKPGDEVIMPSFTFVSTANAVVLRRAVPVFVDIRDDTLNIDDRLIESAITPRTKAICVVHYAGVCAEMDAISEIARRHGLLVIEDAAQALLSTYHGRPAGGLGDLACFSFHETKNVTSGEGGALAISNERFLDRAHVIWEKGTNRRAFKLGRVDKYSWIDCGSSFLPSEFMAAILLAQLECAEQFSKERRRIWEHYHKQFAALEKEGRAQRPHVPAHCQHNGHLFYLRLRHQAVRDHLMRSLDQDNISTVFHYVPLHSAPAGLRYARAHGELGVTDQVSASLVRLPLHAGMAISDADRVIERVYFHLPK